ncbi:SH3 and multiple ankyrin repeat domains 3 [Amazona aestiva]|uniref:SH3 and multiple ankyrin repeat domains 3 n=1 Tax=Amazona aestiva TaxID=12930 RepID=A0A0Q3LUT3_AMAAE|nr:SH3 and multiple ankyrin repeat domains 3 [Amazona aestiva]
MSSDAPGDLEADSRVDQGVMLPQVMLSRVMLSWVMLPLVTLSWVMLSRVTLSWVMLSRVTLSRVMLSQSYTPQGEGEIQLNRGEAVKGCSLGLGSGFGNVDQTTLGAQDGFDLALAAEKPVLSIGEGGFWEGTVKGRTGWFPAECVEEVQMRQYDSRQVHSLSCLRLAMDPPDPDSTPWTDFPAWSQACLMAVDLPVEQKTWT